MTNFSTREAAKKLGVSNSSLVHYIKVGKVPAPQSVTTGGITVHIWSEKEIEHVRQLLPHIPDGRKTPRQQQTRKTKQKQPSPKK